MKRFLKSRFLNQFLKSISVFLFALVLIADVSFADEFAMGSIKGKVKDKVSSEPIIGASVSIVRTTLGSVTNSKGEFVIKNVPRGNYVVRVSAVGYESQSLNVVVEENEEVILDIALREGSVAANEVIVSAARHQQNRVELPVTTNVITESDIEKLPVQMLDQALDLIAGVDMIRSGGGGTSVVNVRGSNGFSGGGLGTRVMMLYDGFMMNGADAGGVEWVNFGMRGVERMEVVKGPASALYGSGAMGGIINVIPEMPTEMTLYARFSNGVYDRPPAGVLSSVYPGNRAPYFYNGTISHGNRLGDLAYNVTYSRVSDQGFRQNLQFVTNDFKLNAEYKLSPEQSLRFTGVVGTNEGGIPTSWSNEANAMLANSPVFADDIKQSFMNMFGLTHSWLIGTQSRIETKAYFHRSGFVIQYYPSFNSQFGNFQLYKQGTIRRGVYNPNDPSTFNDSDARRLGASSLFETQLLENHLVTVGFDGFAEDVRSTIFKNSSSSTFGVFAQDEISLFNKLKITLGVRFDLNRLNQNTVVYTDFMNQIGRDPNTFEAIFAERTAPIEFQTVSQVSPRIALNYKFDDETSLRASAGRSFRAPTLGERFIIDGGIFNGVPNPALNAERMTGYEIGFFKSFGKALSIDVAAYLHNYEGLINAENINPNTTAGDLSSVVFRYRNFSVARIMGIETSLNIRPIDALSVRFNYNLMDARDLSDNSAELVNSLGFNEGNTWLPYQATHQVTFNVEYTLGDFGINLFGRYKSRVNRVILFPAANRYPGDFLVMNLSTRYTLPNGIRITGAVQNFMNLQYEELEQFRAAGRSFHLGVEYSFN